METRDEEKILPTDDKPKPRGFPGFLANLRDSGALASLPGTYLKVVIALYSRRNEKGFSWPSTQTLARDAGVSVASAKRAIHWMRACLGITVKRGGRGRSNSYYLPLDGKVDNLMPFRKRIKRR